MDYEQEALYQRIGKLVAREIQGTITAEEKQWLENFLNQNPVYRKVYHELVNEQHRDELLHNLPAYDGEAAFQRFEQKIYRRPASWTRRWLKISAAAALLFIVATTLYFYTRPTPPTIRQQTIVQDVAPGGNRATLRLSNGKVITLADQKTGKIITETGITITKSADGQLVYTADKGKNGADEGYNTVSTPIGGQYQVTLPDGSKVWLNAASTLTYAPSLRERGDDKRRVRLTGEAYFQIAKDKQHPFIVTTGAQEVEVLGTQFNLNSYENEGAIRTTLLEGSVRIHQTNSNSADKILKPGQQAALAAGSIRISEADVEAVTGWKEGLFVFNNADVPTVMRQLSRWYNIEVEYSGTIPKDLFTGGISRQSNLSTVLQMLELIKIRTKLVQTEKGKKLIVNP